MGDKEFDTTIINLRPNLLSIAMSLTGDEDDAKDLVQDTYLKAYSFKDDLISYDNIKNGLVRILKNTFINSYRTTLRRPLIDRDKDVYNIKIEYYSSDIIYYAKEINCIIDRLSDALRESFQLYVNGYTCQQISDKLHIPVGTIKSSVFRARKIITKQLLNNGY